MEVRDLTDANGHFHCVLVKEQRSDEKKAWEVHIPIAYAHLAQPDGSTVHSFRLDGAPTVRVYDRDAWRDHVVREHDGSDAVDIPLWFGSPSERGYDLDSVRARAAASRAKGRQR